MFDFKIENLDKMILVVSEGKTIEESKKVLEQYLNVIKIEPLKFFHFEIFMNEKVAGAMTIANVDKTPERNRNFRTKEIEESPYLTFTIPYEELLDTGKFNKDFDKAQKEFLKDKGLKMADFPYYEFLESGSDKKLIKIYVRLK